MSVLSVRVRNCAARNFFTVYLRNRSHCVSTCRRNISSVSFQPPKNGHHCELFKLSKSTHKRNNKITNQTSQHKSQQWHQREAKTHPKKLFTKEIIERSRRRKRNLLIVETSKDNRKRKERKNANKSKWNVRCCDRWCFDSSIHSFLFPFRHTMYSPFVSSAHYLFV